MRAATSLARRSASLFACRAASASIWAFSSASARRCASVSACIFSFLTSASRLAFSPATTATLASDSAFARSCSDFMRTISAACMALNFPVSSLSRIFSAVTSCFLVSTARLASASFLPSAASISGVGTRYAAVKSNSSSTLVFLDMGDTTACLTTLTGLDLSRMNPPLANSANMSFNMTRKLGEERFKISATVAVPSTINKARLMSLDKCSVLLRTSSSPLLVLIKIIFSLMVYSN